ncbi:MAG: hypothetical protein JO038_09310, partial [Alphaproteobacteria bacterium]|nr:hypothetical protein [Alphaproteobacteria bacterium]
MATDTWNGIGTWDTDANWSEGHPPAPADDAVIASGQDELDNPGTVVNSLTIDSNAQLILRNTGGTDTVTHDLVNDGFLYVDETGYGNGGSTLTIGGTLTNSSYVFIGNTGLSADTTVSAAALDDSSGIYIEVTGNTNAGTTNQASLEIAGAAPVTLTRNLILQGDALVDFGSGGIATIASGAELELQGSEARVSSGTTPTDTATSTALTGLTDIVGELDLRGNAPAAGGATVTTTTDLDNSGNLFVDYDGYGDGGSTLSIAGTLTNSTNVQIGNTGLSGDTTVSAAALVNTGQIFLTGNTNSGTTDQATINIAGMAPTTLTGDFYLQGDALLDFGSGVIATIASGAEIRLEGSGSRVSSGTTTTDTATSTALTGLTANAGVLDLRGDSPAAGGATVTTTTDLDSSNAIYVDYDGYGDGGSTLSIGGTLTNSGVLFIGNTGLVADTNVSAMALANTSAGQIHIVGNTGSATSDQATFAVGGPAPTSLEGNVFLQGDALLDFASGAIATIASDAFLGLDGAEARVSSGTTPTDTATSTALTGLTDIAGELDLRGNAPAFGGATVTIAGDLANSGDLAVDYDGYGDGGSTLTIGGTLTNSANLNIGNTGLSANTTVTAAGLVNAGTIRLAGNTGAGATDQASLNIAEAAPTVLTGVYILQGDALLDFGSGGIATIESAAELELQGSGARVSSGTSATATATSTALTGLTDIAGELDLRGIAPAAGGATVTIAGDLANSGALYLDQDGYGDGGSTLSIGGMLTNSDMMNIGNTGLSADTTVSAAGLVNNGPIHISGNTGSGATNQASLNIAGAAPTVLSGQVYLQGDALLDFGSGGIATIASGAQLELQGSEARVSSGTTAADTATSTALTGLADNLGILDLRGNAPAAGGATVTLAGNFTNNSYIAVDSDGYGDGSSTLAVGGTLTNAGSMNIGNTGDSGDTLVSAGALLNTGTIDLTSETGNTSSLVVSGAATISAGLVRLYSSGVLSASAIDETGGAIDGDGTLAGVFNLTGGTLEAFDPTNGNALATLTVAGVYNESGAGVLQADINNNDTPTSGVIAVTGGPGSPETAGSVNLQGGTLEVNLESSNLTVGTPYTVMTFGGGRLYGIFGTVATEGSLGTNSGSGTSVALTSGNYAGDTLQVLYNDAAGTIQVEIVSPAAANAYTWIAGPGNWDTAADWSPTGVPGPNSAVTIGAGSGGTVTLSHDATVSSLTVTSSYALNSTAGTLAVNGNVIVSQGGTLAAGGVNDGGAFIDNGAVTLNGALTSLGTITVGSTGSLSLTGGAINMSTVTGSGAIGTPGGNSGALYNVTLTAGTTFTGADNSTTNLYGTIDNAGTISVDSTGDNTDLRASDGTTLTGGGTVLLSDNPNNRIFGTGNSGSETLTNVNNTIAGAGQFSASNRIEFINEAGGTIDATGASHSLVITPTTNSSVATPNGGGFVNAGLLEATDAGGLVLNGGGFNNKGGTIKAVGSGNNVYLQQGAVISGGLLTTSGGGLIEVATGQSGSLDGSSQGALTNAGTFLVADNGALFLSGVIDNTGTINLASTVDNTDLRASNGTTLTGGGTVLLSDEPNNRIFGASDSGNETLTNVNNTIEGSGQFSASNRIEFINQAGGTIDATGASHSLVITPTTNSSVATPNGGGFVNAGLLEATGAGGLVLNSGGFNNKGGTIKAVGSGNNVYLQSGATVSGGLLTTSGGGLIEVATGQSGSLDGSSQGAITNAGTFLVADNGALFLSGVIDNTGTINLASTVDNTDLRASDGTTLTGSGTVLLSDEPNNRIFGSANNGNETLTNLNNTIEGSGQFGASNRIEFINEVAGTIDATGSTHSLVITPTTNSSVTTPNGGGFVNMGLLEATGAGGLVLSNGGFNNKGGTIEAIGSGNNVYLQSGATVSGGLLTTSGGGLIEVATGQTGSLDGSSQGAITNAGTFLVADSGALFVSGVIDNTGTINLASTGDNTDLRASDGTTLTGSGTVLLSDNPNNRIFGTGNSGSETLTNVNNTIAGAGQFSASNRIEFINEAAGTIDATGASHSLVITPTTNGSVTTPNGGGFVNAGLLEATGAGGLVLNSGGFNNKGGTIEAIGSGNNVYLQSGATVSGGLLTTS